MIEKLLLVALGGGLGAVLRFLSVLTAMRWLGSGFPWGTAIVNVAGSFAMGVLAVVLLERAGTERWAPLVLTGLLGGFTTFSAFSLDAIYLLDQGRIGASLGYVAASVVASVAALGLGLWLGRSLFLA